MDGTESIHLRYYAWTLDTCAGPDCPGEKYKRFMRQGGERHGALAGLRVLPARLISLAAHLQFSRRTGLKYLAAIHAQRSSSIQLSFAGQHRPHRLANEISPQRRSNSSTADQSFLSGSA